MQIGQYLDHDITLTPEHESESSCCLSNNTDPECMKLTIPASDPFYRTRGINEDCFSLTRSTQFCAKTKSNFGITAEREQFNRITSFVDASNVYGSYEYQGIKDIKLRSYVVGKLRVGAHDSLPREGHCKVPIAGDIRASEQPALLSMHTLFVKEHNRVCDEIWKKSAIKDWYTLGKRGCVRDKCDELIYQNARRIVTAEWQNIIYQEYLPIVLGPKVMRKFGLNLNIRYGSTYNKNENPNIFNEFATAAYRFGHSLIPGTFDKPNLDGSMNKTWQLSNEQFKSREIICPECVDQIIFGLVRQKPEPFDRFLTKEVTDLLFKEKKKFGQDLDARNIMRGRDHGLPGYSKFYKKYGPRSDANRNMNDWNQRPASFSQVSWNLLKKVYLHPHDIELWSGGLMEKTNAKDGEVGIVFRSIIGLQFKKLLYGDRFFFTHKGKNSIFS